MRFPKRVKYRGRVLATIYGKSKSYPLYRVSWTSSGRRMMQSFRTYSEANRHADAKKTELARGSAAAALTAGQARDALAAFVEEFIKAEEPRTKASDGQRAQVSGKYHYNRAIMLRRFAGTFPNTAVCDLTKAYLDTFIGSLGQLKVQVPQSPRRDFGQEPQPSPRRGPAVPAMVGSQGLSASRAPPERSGRHAAGTGE